MYTVHILYITVPDLYWHQPTFGVIITYCPNSHLEPHKRDVPYHYTVLMYSEFTSVDLFVFEQWMCGQMVLSLFIFVPVQTDMGAILLVPHVENGHLHYYR